MLDHKSEVYVPVLPIAAKNGHEKAVLMLLGHSRDINEQDLESEATALLYACKYNHMKVFNILFSQPSPPDVDKPDKNGINSQICGSIMP